MLSQVFALTQEEQYNDQLLGEHCKADWLPGWQGSARKRKEEKESEIISLNCLGAANHR